MGGWWQATDADIAAYGQRIEQARTNEKAETATKALAQVNQVGPPSHSPSSWQDGCGKLSAVSSCQNCGVFVA
eukprot:COSAG01_NODE_3720_length_5764_cov_13.900618_4_plen_73_part_00